MHRYLKLTAAELIAMPILAQLHIRALIAEHMGNQWTALRYRQVIRDIKANDLTRASAQLGKSAI